MTLHLDLSGITARLRITDYHPSAQGDWTGEWCKTDFSFHSAPWLDYHQKDDEVFLCREIEELYAALDDLLHDRLPEPQEIVLMEPDFTFRLHPRRDLRQDPRITYLPSGADPIVDICADWTVTFWHNGLTGNYLSLALDRQATQHLCTYFGLLTGQISEEAPEVQEMLENGILQAD